MRTTLLLTFGRGTASAAGALRRREEEEGTHAPALARTLSLTAKSQPPRRTTTTRLASDGVELGRAVHASLATVGSVEVKYRSE